MEDTINKLKVSPEVTIKQALKMIGEGRHGALFICDGNNRLLGSLTDGDIRRRILSGGGLDEKIDNIYNKSPLVVKEDYSADNVKQLMLDSGIRSIPVINRHKEITDILLWDNVFRDEKVASKNKIDIPVVIMAGGEGTRLDPFTKVLPKPLIPIGETTVIDIIMDRFYQHGIKEFYISINHKAKVIKSYFEETNVRYIIHYLEEEKPLGTAGSLKFLEGKVHGSVLVSNCDIIIDYDYAQIIEFHKRNGYDMTLVGSFRHQVIPYGICEIENGGLLKEIREKPEYDFLANTGMHIIKASVLSLIPADRKFDITDLIDNIKNSGGKVGVFPIAEKAWTDIGQWEEYRHAIEKMRLLK